MTHKVNNIPPGEPEEVCSSYLTVASHSMTLLGYYDRVHE